MHRSTCICKKDGLFVAPLRGLSSFGSSWRVQPEKVDSRSFCGNFQSVGPKKNITGNNTSEVIPVRGEKHFKPHLLNRTLVPPRVFFKISDEHPVLYISEFLQGHSTEID